MSPWVLTVAGSREDFSAVGRMRLRSFPLVANFFLDKIEQPISYKRMFCWRLEPSYTVYSKWHTLQNHVEIIGRTQTNIHGVSFFFCQIARAPFFCKQGFDQSAYAIQTSYEAVIFIGEKTKLFSLKRKQTRERIGFHCNGNTADFACISKDISNMQLPIICV